ncbi:MAG: matrixin family metalloprotease [Gammaproteobacteria bacterium]
MGRPFFLIAFIVIHTLNTGVSIEDVMNINARFFIVTDGNFKSSFDNNQLYMMMGGANSILLQAGIWLNWVDNPAALVYRETFSSDGFDRDKHKTQLLRHPQLLGRHTEKMKIFVVGKIAKVVKNGKWSDPQGIGIPPSAPVLAHDQLLTLSDSKRCIALAHEIGHCLGLEHQETDNNVMRENTMNAGIMLDKAQAETMQNQALRNGLGT